MKNNEVGKKSEVETRISKHIGLVLAICLICVGTVAGTFACAYVDCLHVRAILCFDPWGNHRISLILERHSSIIGPCDDMGRFASLCSA